jgi:hypothetical protein
MTTVLIAALIAQSVPSPPTAAPEVGQAAGDQPAPGRSSIQMREVFWGDRHGHLRHRPVAFAGERPLEGADFYRAVGRPDLAAEYERRQSSAQAWFGAGLMVALAGTVGAVAIAHDRHDCPALMQGCQRQTDPALAAASVVGILTGGLVMVSTVNASPEPVSDEERRALVTAHNRALHAAPAGPVSVRPAATVSPSAALLGVRGSF